MIKAKVTAKPPKSESPPTGCVSKFKCEGICYQDPISASLTPSFSGGIQNIKHVSYQWPHP